MFSALLNAARLAMPAATGPAAILVPTLLYIVACRKFDVSISAR